MSKQKLTNPQNLKEERRTMVYQQESEIAFFNLVTQLQNLTKNICGKLDYVPRELNFCATENCGIMRKGTFRQVQQLNCVYVSVYSPLFHV